MKGMRDSEECGSCYGAIHGFALIDPRTWSPLPSQRCCNTCEEVREAYRLRGWVLENLDEVEQCKNDVVMRSLKEQAGEGCRVWGKVDVGKVRKGRRGRTRVVIHPNHPLL